MELSSNTSTIENPYEFNPELLKNNSEPELKNFQEMSEKLKKKAIEKMKDRKEREQKIEVERQIKERLEGIKNHYEGLRINISNAINQNIKDFELIKKSEIVCSNCALAFNGISSDRNHNGFMDVLTKEPALIYLYYNKDGDLRCPKCGTFLSKKLIF